MNIAMQNFNLETHIGTDGILHLDLPVAVRNTEMQVTIICKPIAEKSSPNVWDNLQAFREKHNLDELDIDTQLFDADRKDAQERDIEL